MHTIVPPHRHLGGAPPMVPSIVAPQRSRQTSALVVGVPCEGDHDRIEALLDAAADLSREERCPVVLLHALWRQDELHEPADVVRARRVRHTRELLEYARLLLAEKAGDRRSVSTLSPRLPPVTALVEAAGFSGLLLLQHWRDAGQEAPSTLISAVTAQAHCPVLVQERSRAGARVRPRSMARPA